MKPIFVQFLLHINNPPIKVDLLKFSDVTKLIWGFGSEAPNIFGSLVLLNYLRDPRIDIEYCFFIVKYFFLNIYITFKLL